MAWGQRVRQLAGNGAAACRSRETLLLVRFSSNNCSTDAGPEPQHCANASTATSTSQGKIDLPPIRANGPSDSVKTRARGIRLVNSIPRLPLNIAGPTLNQHPRAIARSSSRTVPENQ